MNLSMEYLFDIIIEVTNSFDFKGGHVRTKFVAFGSNLDKNLDHFFLVILHFSIFQISIRIKKGS